MIRRIFNIKHKEQYSVPNIEEMGCMLGREFHQCDVHRCSTYGCFNCGQYQKLENITRTKATETLKEVRNNYKYNRDDIVTIQLERLNKTRECSYGAFLDNWSKSGWIIKENDVTKTD